MKVFVCLLALMAAVPVSAQDEVTRLVADVYAALARTEPVTVGGRATTAEGRELARRLAESAVALAPGNADARVAMGDVLVDSSPDAAEAEYRLALAARPGFVTARIKLAEAMRMQGKFTEAVTELRDIIRADPGAAKAHSDLGMILREQKSLPEAVAAYREAIRLAPDDSDAHNGLAITFARLGRLEDAVTEFREMVRIDPDSTIAHYNLAYALADLDRDVESAAALREVIRINPNHFNARYNLGELFRMEGKFDESARQFREYLRLAPDTPQNRRNITRARDFVSKFEEPAASATPGAQQSPAGGPPAFEVATIKLAAPDAVRNRVLHPSPNRLSIPGMTLAALIYAAYGNGAYNTSMRVTGGPDWVNTTAFSVEAVASGPAPPRQMRLMLQTLLAERFALKLQSPDQTGDVPMNDVLALVVDRSDGTLGPGVRKWDGTCPAVAPAHVFPAQRRPLQMVDGKLVVGPVSETDDPAVPYCPTGYRVGGIRVDGATMSTVAEMLSLPPARAMLGTITQDRTGLTERYTLELDYFFPPSPAAAQAQPEFASPSLSTAVREQWGLRLVPAKGQLRVIVVESAQLPAGN